jgi:hypothetical protein
MERVIFENTYGYEDFITEDERLELESWAMTIKDKMGRAQPVSGEADQKDEDLIRHFAKLSGFSNIPTLFEKLKLKIIELEGIEKYLPAPINGDWIGILGENSYVEPHKDDNLNDQYYTRRYNLLVSAPLDGGRPIYGGKLVPIKDKLLWRCDAGLVTHTSEKVIGDKLRINLSFGFSISIEWEKEQERKKMGKIIKSLI